LLVALALLWQSTRTDATPSPQTESIATPSARTSGTAAATPSPGASASAGPTSSATRSSRPAPSVPTQATVRADDELSYSPAQHANEGLEYGAKQLHAQTAAVEPLVRECVDKAVIAGQHPSGTAMLTYIVAQRADKFVIETTGVDNEKTTLQQEGLLDCLHQTAKAMKFEGLPKGAHEIYAARTVTIEDGKITEYKHVTFSYLR